MTRKDFILISEGINDHWRWETDEDSRAIIYATAESVANKIRSSNPNFNKQRFLADCTKEN